MTHSPEFDQIDAHRFFSVGCFNKAWDLLDKPTRTPEEDEEMLRLGFASYWHWTHRPDCEPGNLSISYWQLSRIYAVLGQADNSRRYGELCLEISQGEGMLLFQLGYAYEALARAERVAGNASKVKEYLVSARQVAEQMTDENERKQLLTDLDTIQQPT